MSTQPAVNSAPAAFTFTLNVAQQATLCDAFRAAEVAQSKATSTAASKIKALLPDRAPLSEESAAIVINAVKQAVHVYNVNARREAKATGCVESTISSWNVNSVLRSLGYRQRAVRTDAMSDIDRACAALVKACSELTNPVEPIDALRTYLARTASEKVEKARKALADAEAAAKALTAPAPAKA